MPKQKPQKPFHSCSGTTAAGVIIAIFAMQAALPAVQAAPPPAVPGLDELAASLAKSDGYQQRLVSRQKALAEIEAICKRYPFVIESLPPLNRLLASDLRVWYRRQGERLTMAAGTLHDTTPDEAIRALTDKSSVVHRLEAENRAHLTWLQQQFAASLADRI